MNFFKDLKVDYQAGNKGLYNRRESEFKNQYWHQELSVSSVEKIQNNNIPSIGIIGYVCDAGVQRNQGRIGTRKGPKSIRNKLGKLPIHFENKKIIDFGDVICIDDYLEDCQKAMSKSISALIKNTILPIAIGGGHDLAYANFNGIKDALKNSSKNKIGIINFDAHFDLRAVKTQPNSGTPFNQILTENKTTTYFAIGIQQQSNSKELFEIANKNKVSYVSNFECETFNTVLKSKLSAFIKKVDYLYITIDLDGFSSAFAPGVSAPSPLGFSPSFVYQVLIFLFKSKKVISCDIAELNPDFDIDESTANLGARLVDYIVQNI
ncbi:MAG: formimidoylglutamase [Bacteroidetes bacterium]|jgi:formiminoglutamase|nr:MAG: formiminoglutamase [Cryomorphaceae bacterium BACL29 MAG-121220-bin8]MDA0757603.1 formimidoylglutamase [Bacteroidota bacterium]MDA1018927.1 formimidoylglutamase [Bacteroidota bacterium]|tara:strand:+ start:50561 stop:51526 length:966 start_codon:yes stop_codon:yes gene_type:complete